MGPAAGAWLEAFFVSQFFVTVVRTILVNVAVSYLQRALMSESRKNLPPINITIRDPVENRRIIFGRARSGCRLFFVK